MQIELKLKLNYAGWIKIKLPRFIYAVAAIDPGELDPLPLEQRPDKEKKHIIIPALFHEVT